jgi:hypothetical protein
MPVSPKESQLLKLASGSNPSRRGGPLGTVPCCKGISSPPPPPLAALRVWSCLVCLVCLSRSLSVSVRQMDAVLCCPQSAVRLGLRTARARKFPEPMSIAATCLWQSHCLGFRGSLTCSATPWPLLNRDTLTATPPSTGHDWQAGVQSDPSSHFYVAR